MNLSFAQKSLMYMVQNDVKRQVELEDLYRWGNAPDEEIPEMTPIPDSRPNKLSAYKIMSAILP